MGFKVLLGTLTPVNPSSFKPPTEVLKNLLDNSMLSDDIKFFIALILPVLKMEILVKTL